MEKKMLEKTLKQLILVRTPMLVGEALKHTMKKKAMAN